MRGAGRVAAAVIAAVLVLCMPAAKAHAAPACPASVGAPQAIAIEVSTGDVACARGANENLGGHSQTNHNRCGRSVFQHSTSGSR